MLIKRDELAPRKKQRYVENMHIERKKKERKKEKCFKIKVSHRINLDDLSRD